MNFSNYDNNKPYPQIVKFICPKCGYTYPGRKTALSVKFCSECGTPVNGYFEDLVSSHTTSVKEYHKETGRLYELFKKDALYETGLSNHPKKEGLFSYAWDVGHSSGYYNVYCVLNDLAQILL